MISSLRTRKEGPSRVDRLVFAIGDVHGRSDLLAALLADIVPQAGAALAQRPVVIGLGDYIDRGPDSAEVMDQICRLSAAAPFETHWLRGNHEALLASFLQDARQGPSWAAIGGRETLSSYGVEAPGFAHDADGWERARLRLAAAMPLAHRRLLDATKLTARFGDYLFVHAGVRPRTPLARQRESDLLWIREPFLTIRKSCEAVVVHGHTPVREPDLGRWRIAVDTGAYLTGTLTAVRLHEDRRDVLQAKTSR